MSLNPTPKSPPRWPLTALAALCAVVASPVFGGEPSWADRGGSDTREFETSSLWSIVPQSGARFEGQARLDSRQEFKFSTTSTGPYGLYGFNDFGPGSLNLGNTVGLDQPRATYRYTWLSMHEVDLKVGLTSNISQFGPSLRSGFASPLRFGALPQMHLSGVGRLAGNWQVAVDADGLWTARGRSLDLGLHIDYSLSRSIQLFGGYRLTDFVGDAEDFYGSGTVNSANLGLRYRF
jgi:hypothetical protein